MKTLRTILVFTSLFAPLVGEAKGPPAPTPVSPFGYDGKTFTCSDGTFSVDLEFGSYISAFGGGWSFASSYILKGFGVYGPRLSGQGFVAIAKVSNYSTRVAAGDRIKAYLPELKAKLSLLDITYSIYPDAGHSKLGVHGTLELESGKKYNLDCE